MNAGFAEIDITPPVGTRKIGWLKVIIGDHVLDPLYGRVAVLESGGASWAVVQLDTLSIGWDEVQTMRQRIQARYGFPGANIMVTATHNHAGPAVVGIGAVKREDAYVETMIEKFVSCFGSALEKKQPAEIGIASKAEFGVGFNRRVVMRDGYVRTHGTF